MRKIHWRRRNVIDYDDAFVASDTDATEIPTKAEEFSGLQG